MRFPTETAFYYELSTPSPSNDTHYRADTCNNSAAQMDSPTEYSEWLTTHH